MGPTMHYYGHVSSGLDTGVRMTNEQDDTLYQEYDYAQSYGGPTAMTRRSQSLSLSLS